MAKIYKSFRARRRWWFWPAYGVSRVLVSLRVASLIATANWLCDHAIVVEEVA